MTVRLLHVTAAAERGGLEVIVLNIVNNLDRSRFTPQVLFLADGPFVEEVRAAGIETHVIESGRVRQLLRGKRSVARVRQLIRDQEIDIVHTHNSKAHVYGGLAARLEGVPTLYHLQGVPRPSLSRDGLVSLLSVLVPARQTVACSNWVAEAYKGSWHLERSVLVVNSGVMTDTGSFSNPATTVREEFGIPRDAHLVVMATRLQRWKGVHVFLDSASKIAARRRDVVFMVVGGSLFGLEENYSDELRRQVDTMGITESVVFTGYRPDVWRFFDAADIVVHASIEPDPFPTVLLEAMVWAKPVVAPALGGPIEIVEQGVTGLLVTPGDPASMAEAIQALLADHRLRVRLGQAGVRRVKERFSAEGMARRIQGVYEQLIIKKVLR